MSRTSARRRLSHRQLAIVLALSLVVLVGVVLLSDRAPESPPREVPTEAPSSASRSVDFSLPGDVDAVSFQFAAPENDPVLVALTVTATFTASTGEQRALYTIAGMSCGSMDGPTNTQSAGGTENLIHQTTRQMVLLLSYDVQTTGEHRCNARVNAPNWDPEYGDADLSLTATIRLVATEGETHHLRTADSEQPIVLDPGEKVVAVDEDVPLAPGPAGDLDILSTTHLTACTITNGSRDDTESNLCIGSKVDREGVVVTTRTHAQQLRGDTVCRTVTADRSLTTIDHLVHHRLLDSSSSVQGFMDESCGDRLRIVHEVSNDGPAAVVVHRDSTRVAVIAR
jgi:hypothetical protein